MPISSSYTRHSRAASTPSTIHSGSPSRLECKHGDDIGDGSCVSPGSLSGSSSIPRCWRLDLARSKLNADVVGPVKVTSLAVDRRIHLGVVCCICIAVGATGAAAGDSDWERDCTVLDSMAICPCMDEIWCERFSTVLLLSFETRHQRLDRECYLASPRGPSYTHSTRCLPHRWHGVWPLHLILRRLHSLLLC